MNRSVVGLALPGEPATDATTSTLPAALTCGERTLQAVLEVQLTSPARTRAR